MSGRPLPFGDDMVRNSSEQIMRLRLLLEMRGRFYICRA